MRVSTVYSLTLNKVRDVFVTYGSQSKEYVCICVGARLFFKYLCHSQWSRTKITLAWMIAGAWPWLPVEHTRFTKLNSMFLITFYLLPEHTLSTNWTWVAALNYFTALFLSWKLDTRLTVTVKWTVYTLYKARIVIYF